MPTIVSVGTAKLPYQLNQDTVKEYTKQLFGKAFRDIDRLMNIFDNGQIESRYFVKNLDWYKEKHRFSEKNNTYIESALQYGCEAIKNCLQNPHFLQSPIDYEEIEAIFYISTTGIATPSIEARLINKLPFSLHIKRIPIWGLGCAGGAAGLARAYEYCLAFPKAKVLVLAVEFCSLTFQPNDSSKSNLIGTSLFADGVACICVAGDEADDKQLKPHILASQSTFMRHAEDVMGWDICDDGFFVIFSKDIPSLISSWLKPNVEQFLRSHSLTMADIDYFIAHPGGKKVLEAYQKALGIDEKKTAVSFQILKQFGNMSSVTVYFVLEQFMKQPVKEGEHGLLLALGPGFSSELVLLRWGGKQ
ncbi:alkylresorcinol/alkylpyrone synthase [Anoxybacillus calidus]|jgi:alkylresorcinol/alkylpyrone synthase|uniref:Alkylresorcinol/alkylpyrone synthase n=1 Tax=[Anoxybacillus] calidus TaxID=575178 RepID=A0A7V9YXS1_9BACL|nr:3-oxoacyl-[acyl-carrier-protein] synthase III C-terminal domain-containing protein [Anoxybacillus calidus]MBA2870397.1 alkylresorcinol/alkylpyrone synthase [Anoxybacillus calidus]